MRPAAPYETAPWESAEQDADHRGWFDPVDAPAADPYAQWDRAQRPDAPDAWSAVGEDTVTARGPEPDRTPGWDAPPPGPLPQPFWSAGGHDPRLPEPAADWQAPIDPFGGNDESADWGGDRPARTRRERREQLAKLHGEATHEVSQWEYRAPADQGHRRSHRHEAHREHFWDEPDLSTLPPPPLPGPDSAVGRRWEPEDFHAGPAVVETTELDAVREDATQEFAAQRGLAGPAAPPMAPEAGDGAVPIGPIGKDRTGRGWSRGSHVGIRVFAVGLLVVGVGAGAATHILNGSDADTVKVSDQLESLPDSSLPAPGADTGRSQGAQVGSQLLDISRQQAAVDAAQERARKKAKAAKAAADARAERAAESKASRSSDRGESSGGGPSGEQPPSAPVSCSSYSGNRKTGCSLLSWAGFSTTQMSCLDKLWTRESQWTTTAENSSSGAYGIPQALPANKMASYGSDYRTNPVPQIKWGLNYIKGRYGTPCGAWSHSENNGWY